MSRFQFTPAPHPLILFILLVIFNIHLQAATFTVTNLDDSGPGSLRQAVLDANTPTGTHTIEFQPGLTGTITLTSGEIWITGNMTINGPGASVLAISGNNASGVFNVTSLGATISGLMIKEGKVSGLGGGINNSGNLTLSDIILSNNKATQGGGIYNTGSLTATRLTLSGNEASTFGGGVCHSGSEHLTISDSIFTANQAGANGGGINNSYGTLTVTNSVFTNNRADSTDGGGGIGSGGGTLTVTNSTLSGNETAGSGGAILTWQNTLTVTNSTLSGNAANQYGGGIKAYGTTILTNSTLTGNMAISGGGGIHRYTGTLTLNNSIVSGNTALTGKEINGGYSAESSSNLFGENGVSGVEGATPLPSEIIAGPLSAVIGLLADNGGPTQTHGLVAGSPAIDNGNNSLIPTGITTDQRGEGFPRIVGNSVDIGAVESASTGNQVTLKVLLGTNGTGLITSSPVGIRCGYSATDGKTYQDCTIAFPNNTLVTLTALPAPDNAFDAWWSNQGTSCHNEYNCTFNISQDFTIAGEFYSVASGQIVKLTVNRAGTGNGTVKNDVGIDCGSDCTESYMGSRVITLNATPDSGSTFAGWSGDACSGTTTLTCVFTAGSVRNITATFNKPTGTYPLTVSKAGTGSGTVTGTGITCGSDCTESYASGSIVTLTATATSGVLAPVQ